MSEVNVEELFNRQRLPTGWQLLLLCFYFPVGFVLSVLRFFIGLNSLFAFCLIPKFVYFRSSVLKTLCLVLGILIQEENVEDKDVDAKLIVSNHISVLDYFAIDIVLPCIMPTIPDLPHLFSWCLGCRDFGKKHAETTFLDNVKKCCQAATFPLLCHPEETTSNGQAGLLKFSSWPFNLDQAVNPIVITANRPILDNLALSVLGSSWWTDLFWFFFTPCTIFTLKYLPAMRKEEGESEDDFARRVQTKMASALNLSATNITNADKDEYIKRSSFVPPTRPEMHSSEGQRNASDETSAELETMINQVREVLPYVPREVIKRDLVKTKNVDITITKILEGEVAYVPERTIESLLSTRNQPSTSTSPPTDYFECSSPSVSTKNRPALQPSETNCAAAFGTTPAERMQSFQERKRKLIDTARQRFLEKHGS